MTRSKTAESLVSALVILLITLLLILAQGDRPARDHPSPASVPEAAAPRDVWISPAPAQPPDAGREVPVAVGAS